MPIVGRFQVRWRPEGRSGSNGYEELAGDARLVDRVTGQEFANSRPYPESTKKTFPRESWCARRDAKAYCVELARSCQGRLGPF